MFEYGDMYERNSLKNTLEFILRTNAIIPKQLGTNEFLILHCNSVRSGRGSLLIVMFDS